MTIHIDELVVRTVVEEGGAAAPAEPGRAPAGAERDELIAACVERVMEILREREEP